MATDNTSGKYIITPDKFSLDEDNELQFTIYTKYGIRSFNQYLPALRRCLLLEIAQAINIYTSDLKYVKTNELANFLNSKIDFQIPENLIAYKRDSILDKYIDFPQIYIPFNKQKGNTFNYMLTNVSHVDMAHGIRPYYMFTYPFTNRQLKRALVLLCDTIGIMNISTASKYKIGELCELLNEKFVLQERAG